METRSWITDGVKHSWGCYECDGGCLKVGNGSFTACFPNCMGDGRYYCHVLEKDGYISPEEVLGGKWNFEGSIEGDEIIVYDYDGHDSGTVLYTLHGRYGVYAKNDSGDMCLEKW